METFLLEGHPFVALCDLIKHRVGPIAAVRPGAGRRGAWWRVDGQVETRKRCKIVAEQVWSTSAA